MSTRDPLAEILGDYKAFFKQQQDRLGQSGISIEGYSLSHFAFRTLTYPEYLEARDKLEAYASVNHENVWNGRPISKILLKDPLQVGDGFEVPMIELIPPQHQCLYRMGLEHTGVVIGEDVDEFCRTHRAVLTGQQFQTLDLEPYFVRFGDYTNVKFYRQSLHATCVAEGRDFTGFFHVEHWHG